MLSLLAGVFTVTTVVPLVAGVVGAVPVMVVEELEKALNKKDEVRPTPREKKRS